MFHDQDVTSSFQDLRKTLSTADDLREVRRERSLSALVRSCVVIAGCVAYILECFVVVSRD